VAQLVVGHEAQYLIWYTGTAVGEMGAPPKGWHATLRSDTRTPVWDYVRCGCVPRFATASAVVLFRGGCFRYESGLGNSYVVCDHVAVSSGTKTKVKCDDRPRAWSQREAAVALKMHSWATGGCLPWLTLFVRRLL